MTANVAANQAISGLTASTAYKIYFVAKDTANNDQAAVSNVAVTTDAAPAGPDTTPDSITLVDQNNVALSTVITSAPITVQ
ncbi:MAG: hypothetical protein ACYC6S_05815 [Desulfobulbia bacterium]